MSDCGVTISSDNFNGMQTNVVYMPDTGGTITIGPKVFPFTYLSDYFYGTYECYIPTYKYVYSVVVPGPTPTPTVTPTITPTPQPTPTPSPVPVYLYNLWTDGVMTDVCQTANEGFGPSNITIYSPSPSFDLISIGGYVYGDDIFSIPPVTTTDIISDGATWIQIDIMNGQVIDTGICP